MIKLGDFGLAAQLEHSCSRRDTACGGSQHLAPEVYEGKAELKSDVWSLDISLLELAEGKSPYDGCSSEMVIDKDPPPLSEKWSAEFAAFVKQCLVMDVKGRWSAEQLMDASVLSLQ